MCSYVSSCFSWTVDLVLFVLYRHFIPNYGGRGRGGWNLSQQLSGKSGIHPGHLTSLSEGPRLPTEIRAPRKTCKKTNKLCVTGCFDNGSTCICASAHKSSNQGQVTRVCRVRMNSYCFQVGNYCILVMLPKLNTAETNYFCFNVPPWCGTALRSRWRLSELSGPCSARSIRWKVGHSLPDKKRVKKNSAADWDRNNHQRPWLKKKAPVSSMFYVCGYWVWKQISKVSHNLFVRFFISNQKLKPAILSKVRCTSWSTLLHNRWCNLLNNWTDGIFKAD